MSDYSCGAVSQVLVIVGFYDFGLSWYIDWGHQIHYLTLQGDALHQIVQSGFGLG